MSNSTNQTQANDATGDQVDMVRAQLQRHLQLLAVTSMMMDRVVVDFSKFLDERELAFRSGPYVDLTELERKAYSDFCIELKEKVYGYPRVSLEALVTTRSIYPGKFIGRNGPYPAPLMRHRDLGVFRDTAKHEIANIETTLNTQTRCGAIEEPVVGGPTTVE